MTFAVIFLAIVILICLIVWAKVNPFLAFLVVGVLTGLLLGMPLNGITKSMYKGIGDTLGSIVSVIILGAMLGKLVAESGAAERIASVMMNVFGEKYILQGLMVTGFIVGIPLFYNTGFVLMVPLVFSVAYKYKLPVVYTGLPLLASLSAMHGLVPPHPSPTILIAQFGADIGLTFLYGISIAIPAVLLAGLLYAQTLKKIVSVPLPGFVAQNIPEEKLPGTGNSFFSSLLPVLMLMIIMIVQFAVPAQSKAYSVCVFFADPSIIMLLAVMVATFTLGMGLGKSIKQVMDIYGEAVKDVAMILLIIGGAGALKQILVDSGVSDEIAAALNGSQIQPLLLGWLIAALIRVCLGSATVAGLTAAGIMLPVIKQTGADANLMVLSIGSGSLMLSHFNDGGFWLFKEYFNLSVKDTLRSWTVMESIISVAGLGGVMVWNFFLH